MTAPTTQAEQEDAVRERYTVVYEGDSTGVKILSGEAATGRAVTVMAGDLWEEARTLRAERDAAVTRAAEEEVGAAMDRAFREIADLRVAEVEAQRDQLAADLRKAREERDAHFMSLAAATCELMRGAHSGGAEIQALRKVCLLQARELKRLDPDGDTPVDLNAAMEKLRAALTPDPTDAGGTAKGDDHG